MAAGSIQKRRSWWADRPVLKQQAMPVPAVIVPVCTMGMPIQKEETMVGNAHHAGPMMGWVNGSWDGSEGAWHGRGGEGGCRWINPKEAT
jgi:hypothetical protein